MKTSLALATIALASVAACSSDTNSTTPTKLGESAGTAGQAPSDASVDVSAGGNAGGGNAGAGGGAGSSGTRCPFDNFTILADGGCACVPGTDKICDAPSLKGGVAPTCIDSTTDPNNCGGCGTKCDPTVACIGGKCGKAPTALVAAAAGCTSIHLAYDGGKIYWTDQGHGMLKSVATTGGGAPTPLATGEMAPTLLLVNGGNVYWIDSGNDTIRTVSTGGGTPKSIVTMAPTAPATVMCDNNCMNASVPENKGIHGIAMSPDGSTLYFSAGTDVYKVPKAGGAVVNVGYSEGPRHGIPNALAVDGKYVYYPTALNGNIELMSINTICDLAAATLLDPTCPFRQARSQQVVFDTIYVKGDNIYWAVDQVVRVGSVSAKMDAGVNGGNAGIDYSSSVFAGNVTGFALGSANAYFGEFPAGGGKPEEGYIEKAPNPPYAKDMSPNAVVIARKQPMPTSFAVDGTNVYWTTSDCDIMTIADSPQ
jgi:hypothetical protein